jgi:hypothetical protein
MKHNEAVERAAEAIAMCAAQKTIDQAKAAIDAYLAAMNETQPAPKKFGCHCDLFDVPNGYPDGCVLDYGAPGDCVYATHIERKEQCEYWQEITPESLKAAGVNPVSEPQEGGKFKPTELPIITCEKCGAKAVAFNCSEKGCPVNGGAYYG